MYLLKEYSKIKYDNKKLKKVKQLPYQKTLWFLSSIFISFFACDY